MSTILHPYKGNGGIVIVDNTIHSLEQEDSMVIKSSHFRKKVLILNPSLYNSFMGPKESYVSARGHLSSSSIDLARQTMFPLQDFLLGDMKLLY